MKALVAFNEIDIPKIKIGAKAEITLDAFPGEIIKGGIFHFLEVTGLLINRNL